MEKKYQIFISSTYKDLIEARSKVRDAILSMMHFPVGMEMFNAADEEQWEIIQETIDSSDYYVLILGQRYGSVIESGSDAGISYTEKEFRYAREKKIPVLVFIIDDDVVYAQKETKVALNNLHSVIRDPHQLKNYVPARENELNIMTLHKSKGLEFNIVFHMDMYKWIIPNEFGDESSVQQDLNLHYVGLTRAKDACYIMNGTARFRSKKNDYIFAEPSLFLSKPGLAERRKDVRWEM